MPSTDAFALKRSGLNNFLFAAVGNEPNGMTLSLVSVFARLGNDPWGEAARLAGLPKTEAIDSLARTIANMPRSGWALPDAVAIATRLIPLLPTRPESAATEASTYRANVGRFVRIGLLVAAAALGMMGVTDLFTTRAPPSLDGSDVASFATPAPPPPASIPRTSDRLTR
jgi:hypothetical protein